MALALDGIRVIDFGRYIAGPYAAMLLGDMGAEVIRVDRRGGSEDRYLGPVAESGEGGMFLSINRNKRSLTLDPSKPGADEVIRRLVSGADVVVANLPMPVLKKMGIDYDSLKALKPDIILMMVSTFGPDGPYAERVGFDGVVQAMSGAMSLTGFAGPPVRGAVPFEDYGTALHGAFGVMTALYHRERTGEGQCIDVSLLATGVTFMVPLLAERAVNGIQREQWGNRAFWAGPSDCYKTKDGWLLVAVNGRPMFKRWARAVGREDLIEDPDLNADLDRAENADKIDAAMVPWCEQRTTDEAIAELEKARVPCGPVFNTGQVLEDPQVRARGLLKNVAFPGAKSDPPIADTPVRLSATPGGIRQRAPLPGEHTDEVLAELGFGVEEIATFKDADAV